MDLTSDVILTLIELLLTTNPPSRQPPMRFSVFARAKARGEYCLIPFIILLRNRGANFPKKFSVVRTSLLITVTLRKEGQVDLPGRRLTNLARRDPCLPQRTLSILFFTRPEFLPVSAAVPAATESTMHATRLPRPSTGIPYPGCKHWLSGSPLSVYSHNCYLASPLHIDLNL